MASSSPFRDNPGGRGVETLADVLARGSLSLAAALHCASDVARLLHELHQQERTHGRVAATTVLMRPSGAELVPSRGRWDLGSPEGDVREFGALLYEMVTGARVPADASAAVFRFSGSPSGPAGIRAAAIRVAGKCLGHLPVQLTMQQAATEVRLLWVVARQLESDASKETGAAPFVVPSPEAPAVERTGRMDENSAPPVVPVGPGSFGKPQSKAARLAPAGRRCPKCASGVVYLARPRSAFESWMERCKIPICRCHRCYHRYIVVLRMRIGKEMPPESDRPFTPKRRG